MADVLEERDASASAAEGSDTAGSDTGGRRLLTRGAIVLACMLLGFAFVAQIRSAEDIGEGLEAEREEDLARILSDLTAESDRLQNEITDLRLLLIEFETSAETEELALRNLQRRLADLQILAGTVPAEGEGIQYTIEDPSEELTQELLVDVVQELRDAGAEAVAVNGVRLVVSSGFSTRNERVLVDGEPLEPPYRIAAVGPAETMAKALDIPGGALDTVERSMVNAESEVETLSQLTVPAREQAPSFVFGEPIDAED